MPEYGKSMAEFTYGVLRPFIFRMGADIVEHSSKRRYKQERVLLECD